MRHLLVILFFVVVACSAQTPQPENAFPTDRIWATEISGDGRMLVGTGKGVIKIWDRKSGTLQKSIPNNGEQVTYFVLSPDSTMVLAGGLKGSLRVWETRTGELKKQWSASSLTVDSVAFCSNGRFVASASGDRMIRVWELSSGNLVSSAQHDIGEIESLDFSPDCSSLASTGDDANVYVWDTKTGKQRFNVNELLLISFKVKYSKDGKQLIFAGAAQQIYFADAESGKILKVLPKASNPIGTLDASPDIRRIAALHFNADHMSDAAALSLWDVASGSRKTPIDDRKVFINGCRFLDDGRLLATGWTDGKLMVWTWK